MFFLRKLLVLHRWVATGGGDLRFMGFALAAVLRLACGALFLCVLSAVHHCQLGSVQFLD